MNRIRTIAIGVSLVVTLSLPASALAVTTTGTTNETVSVTTEVSMVVPSSVSYLYSGGVATGPITLTGIGCNDAAGMRIKAVFSDLVGPITVPVTNRDISPASATGGIDLANLNPVVPEDTTTQRTLMDHAADGAVESGSTATWDMTIDGLSAVGSYSGSIVFTGVCG